MLLFTLIKQMRKYKFIVLIMSIVASPLVGYPAASALPRSMGNNVTAQPTITIVTSDPAAAEAGPDAASFTVMRSGDTGEALQIEYVVAGTAQASDDYKPLTGNVSIQAGASSAIFVLTPRDDKDVEGAETVIVSLSANDDYQVVAPSSATATIADDNVDSQIVRFYIDDPSAAEAGPDAGRFTIARDGNTAAPLTVYYTIGGTALSGVDYPSLAGSATIPAGQASTTIDVAPSDDRIVEQIEIIVLALSSHPSYTVEAPTSATVTITDNDMTPSPAPSGQRLYLPVVIKGS
jgi:hypothetical protein